MMMKKRPMSLQSLLMAGALAFAFTIAMPATSTFANGDDKGDGDVGETSSGELDVTLEVDELVRISSLDDLDFDLEGWNGGDISEDDGVCVWSNTDAYDVTATSDNGVGLSFFVSNGLNTLEYEVDWSDTTSTVNLDNAVTSGVHDTDADTLNCDSGNTAAIEVTFTEAELALADGGTVYDDTLTVIVTPE